MKKYEALRVEINEAFDIITTSAEVTTEKIKFPWESATSESSVNIMSTVDLDSFEV